MKEGKLVPMDITIALMKEAMVNSKSRRFLIDGTRAFFGIKSAFASRALGLFFCKFLPCFLGDFLTRVLLLFPSLFSPAPNA